MTDPKDALRTPDSVCSRSAALLELAEHMARFGSFEWNPESDELQVSTQLTTILGGHAPTSVQELLALLEPQTRPEVEAAFNERSSEEVEALATIEERQRVLTLKVQELAPDNVVGVIVDRTPSRQAHKRAQRAERMASIGTLAAGIIHEVNNPLTFILSNLDFASHELARDSWDSNEVKAALHDAVVGAQQACEIVNNLKHFAAGSSDKASPVSLADSVAFAHQLVRGEFSSQASFRAHGLDTLPAVLGNESQLVQILVNLFANAAHSFAETRRDTSYVEVWGTVKQRRVCLYVKDNGCGMSPAIQRRIFEPFFSTKGDTSTGIGLSIVAGIVRDMGAEIAVESEPDVGTTFTLNLPIA